MKLTLLSLLLLAGINLVAQPSASPADKVIQALELKENAKKSSLVKNLKFTNIGPTVMSGRVTDIDANPLKPVSIKHRKRLQSKISFKKYLLLPETRINIHIGLCTIN